VVDKSIENLEKLIFISFLISLFTIFSIGHLQKGKKQGRQRETKTERERETERNKNRTGKGDRGKRTQHTKRENRFASYQLRLVDPANRPQAGLPDGIFSYQIFICSLGIFEEPLKGK
jgi:hypothetical protein